MITLWNIPPAPTTTEPAYPHPYRDQNETGLHMQLAQPAVTPAAPAGHRARRARCCASRCAHHRARHHAHRCTRRRARYRDPAPRRPLHPAPRPPLLLPEQAEHSST